MTEAAAPSLPMMPNTENIRKIRDVILEKQKPDEGPSEGGSITDLSGEFGSQLKPVVDILSRIRNVLDINLTLKEAFRVLKTGGRFMCLEFSKVENPFFRSLYKNYSKLIPKIGKKIVGSSEPYDYLIKSIDKFYNQQELLDLIKKFSVL